MTKKQTNIIKAVFVIVALIGFIYGIRAWQMSSINAKIKDGQLLGGFFASPIMFGTEKYLVPPNDIYEIGSTKPAIDNPEFVSIANADSYLADDVYGIDINVNGEHRYYSYQMLNWHEVVNDTFGDKKMVITHCELCMSSAVYETSDEFEHSGLVYNNNQLIKDKKTGSLWSQITGLAISGKRIGDTLTTYPFQVITWTEFKNSYPNGLALSNNTGFQRDYTSHPYSGYDTSKTVYFPINFTDIQISPKAPVQGYQIGNGYLMVSKTMMALTWAWNAVIDNQSVSVLYDINKEQNHVYLTAVDSQTLTFKFDIANNIFIDDQTKSAWNVDGFALSGSLAGTQLTELTDDNKMFAMCWAGVHPNTLIILKTNSIGGGLLGSNDKKDDQSE